MKRKASESIGKEAEQEEARRDRVQENEKKEEPARKKRTASAVENREEKKDGEDRQSKDLWEAIWDNKYERNYYYNRVTGESTWDVPKGYRTEEKREPSNARESRGDRDYVAQQEGSRKLFVGNLDFLQTTTGSLRKAFETVGVVDDCRVVMDRIDPKKSRGFGFVSFRSASEARKAYDVMNDYELDGRRIRVRIDEGGQSQHNNNNTLSDRNDRGGDRDRGGPSFDRTGRGSFSVAPLPSAATNNTDPSKLYIGNLSFITTSRDLREAFEKFGELHEVKVIMDRYDPTRSRGFGFVTFRSASDARKACEAMHESVLKGRRINVNIKRAGGDIMPQSNSMPRREYAPKIRDDREYDRRRHEAEAVPPPPAQAERESGGTNRRVYVAGLARTATPDEIQKLFGQLGQVQRIKQKRGYPDQWPWKIKMYTDEKGAFKGDCVISFVDPNAAKNAPKFFNDYVYNGNKLSVQLAKEPVPPPSGSRGISHGGAARDSGTRHGGYGRGGGGGGGYGHGGGRGRHSGYQQRPGGYRDGGRGGGSYRAGDAYRGRDTRGGRY